jgi:hypothetical protein
MRFLVRVLQDLRRTGKSHQRDPIIVKSTDGEVRPNAHTHTTHHDIDRCRLHHGDGGLQEV